MAGQVKFFTCPKCASCPQILPNGMAVCPSCGVSVLYHCHKSQLMFAPHANKSLEEAIEQFASAVKEEEAEPSTAGKDQAQSVKRKRKQQVSDLSQDLGEETRLG